MLNSLLAIVAGDDGNWYFDNYAESLIYALIGFLIVFAGIVILICIIWLVGLLMRKTNNLAFLTERKTRKKNKKAAAVSEEIKAAQPVTVADEDIPDEVKAAIIAAIMAYYQEQEPKCEFTVKRIKRL